VKSFSLFSIVLLLIASQLTGCATYGNGIEQALIQVDQGNYAAAATKIESTLNPTGKDRLLYHLELGVLKHLEGDYQASNDLLERASLIIESLQQDSVSDSLVAAMSNPRNIAYAGNTHERVLIYYYKAMNYLAIAATLPEGNAKLDAKLDAIEGARIESRRLILRLQALRNNEGSYDNAKDDNERTFSQVLRVFSVLMGNLVNTDTLTYRDDALAHYLTGVSFEMNKEYDNARISYQKAAESYDKGYAEQFRLGNGMSQQAWFDVARMMQRSEFSRSEWQKVSTDQLPASMQQELLALADSPNAKAQILVVEHKGRVPEKKELNLQLSINPNLRALELQPYFFEYTQEQIDWFYLLYADKLIYGLVADYLNATRNLRIDFFTKTIFLGPLYETAENMGLTQAIGNSLRVTVPYYDPPTQYGDSLLTVGQQTWTLDRAASPQQMAIQEQMKNAGPEIREALGRAAAKAMTAAAIGQQDSTGLLAFAGKLAAQLSDAAETRSWLLLPAEVHIRRLFIEPGNYTLTLNSTLADNNRQQSQTSLSLAAGDIKFWQVRTMGKGTMGKGTMAKPHPIQNDGTKPIEPKAPPKKTPEATVESTPTSDVDVEPIATKPIRRRPTKD
jgi:hypothetical protein